MGNYRFMTFNARSILVRRELTVVLRAKYTPYSLIAIDSI